MLTWFIFSLFCVAFSEKLPSFIERCSFSDSNLNKCIIEHGNKAWPQIAKGSQKYKILKMDPLQLPSIDFNGGNIQMQFKNFTVYGLESLIITDADWDKKSKHVKIVVYCGNNTVAGQYSIKGQIMVLSIVGNGAAKFVHYDSNITYEFDYDLIKRGGREYIKVENQNADISCSSALYHFENLFNGNKRLTDQMNKFLTDNWRDFFTEMKPTFEQGIIEVLGSATDHLITTIPFDELFLK